MRRTQLLACLLAGLSAWSAMVPAEARRDGGSPRHEEATRERLSLDEAVANVRRDSGGRVLSAHEQAQRGDARYRIKVLLPDASVRSFDVPARERR
jgi:uncharacterized membrane protein YkoI